MQMTVEQISQILPHRYPFLLVDRIEIIDPLEHIRGIKAITNTENFFQGHFPGNPVMPGCLIIEAASQTAGFLVYQADASEKLIGYVAEVNEFKFSGKVQPGVLMEISAKKELKKGPFLIAVIEVSVEGKKVAEGKLTLFITKM